MNVTPVVSMRSRNAVRALPLVGGQIDRRGGTTTRLAKIAVVLTAIVLLAGAALAASSAPSPTPTSPAGARDDVSGPCDEAEHANDPRCDGPQRPEDDPTPVGDGGVVDISGPCDEAEHANDPECTGVTADDDHRGDDDGHDNSGPGSHDDGDDNSGPGSDDDRDDNSGHGSDDD